MWRAPVKLTCNARGIPRAAVLAAQSRQCSKPSTDGKPAADTPAAGKPAAGKPTAAQSVSAKKSSLPPLTAPPPPPPPPPSSSGGGGGAFWKLLGLTVAGAGGVLAYSWYDPQARKTIEKYVPYSKETFDAIFQYVPNQEKLPTKTTSPAVASEEAAMKQGLARPIIVEAPTEEVRPVKPAVVEPPLSDKEAKKAAEEKKKQEEKARVQRRIQEKKAEEAAENTALEEIVKSVIDETVAFVRTSIGTVEDSVKAVRAHNQQLKAAMAEEEGKEWESVAKAHDDKMDSLQDAKLNILRAQEWLERLKRAIEEGKGNAITKKNPVLVGAEQTYNQVNYDLKAAMQEQSKALGESRVMEEYRDLVKKGRTLFRKELQAITPDVPLGGRIGGRMTTDELNSLIAHAHRRVEQLQRQLAEQQALEQLRTQDALQRQQQEDEQQAQQRIAMETDRLKAQWEMEKLRLNMEAGVQFEAELRHQLARQAGAHSEHLQDVLKVQDRELRQKYELIFSEKLADEANKIRGEVSDSITRLHGIEAAIDGRAEMEKQGRKAQELWLACQTLYNVVLLGRQEDQTGDDMPAPLAGEVAAIKEAGNNHPFVNTVLESMPARALEEGVCTEEHMKERFSKVRHVCRRVGMIDESGGTLYKYLVSYLQSLLVFSRSQPLGDDAEVDPAELNTFTLLDNASYWLEKGDTLRALRYMNQLKGEPRRVAADWIADMRCLMETKQAADALLAHASAAGLGSLF